VIANPIMVLLGLWLVYRAIFSVPAGAMNNVELACAGAIVIALAGVARQTDYSHWNSGTNAVLGAVLLALAVGRWISDVSPLAAFWFLLLGGITISIIALWAVLYRPDRAPPPARA